MNAQQTPRVKIERIMLAEAAEMARLRPPFRVPGLVHGSLTGVAGEPYAGKSSLVVHMVTSGLKGEPFLGTAWTTPPDRVVIVCTDPRAIEEYGERFEAAGLRGAGCTLVTKAGDAECWAALRDDPDHPLTEKSLVVIDNLSGSVRALNEEEDDKRFFVPVVQELCSHGVGVVVVLHMSEKRGEGGRRSQTPMGHTYISAQLRHRLTLHRNETTGVIRLTTIGNDAHQALEVNFTQKNHAADLQVLSTQIRQRPKPTLDLNAEKVALLRGHPEAKTSAERALILQSVYGGKLDSIKRSLRPDRPIGELLAA